MNTFNLHLAAILSIFLSVHSCNEKKETSSTAGTNTKQTSEITESTPTVSTAPQNNNVRYVVSFYSIGQGIDGTTHNEFVKFLNSYPKKISFEPKHWGREGETDYCLALSELNPRSETEFITKAKTILAKSKLVHEKENAQCDHVNWPPIPNAATDDTYPLVVSFYSKGEGIDN